MPTPDTLFTAPAHWQWWIVLYFFFGGIAAGAYFLSTLLGAMGDEGDRPLARLGVYIAFPAVLLCGLLLIVDLNRPERFWHMLVQSETLWPMFKAWSPMSVGAWALLIFGAFTFVSLIGALWEAGHIRWQPPTMCCTDYFRHIFMFFGTLVGFFLASYTGVLLSVTNRVIWADSNLIGALFLVSAASTGAAAMFLLARQRHWVPRDSLGWLLRVDRWVLVLELLFIALFLITLGPAIRYWLSVWGVLLAAAVLVGILAPLALHYRPRLLGGTSLAAAAVLALAGGFLLRVAIVLSAELI
ncbi:MAG: NrfD/PsrC family molybdoenzyme membrane anchor subunit [Chloroflexota bacterium]